MLMLSLSGGIPVRFAGVEL